MDALFEQHQHKMYLPTAMAGSPWHRGWLHGGAPAGLLAHCFEQFELEKGFVPARLSMDLIKPVPMSELHVSITPVRKGKRMVLLRASITANGTEVVTATALFIRLSSSSDRDGTFLPDAGAFHVSEDDFPHPDSVMDSSFQAALFGNRWEMPPGLHTAVKIKTIDGMGGKGQGRAWLAFEYPVVEHATISPFVKVATLSDFGNGVGQLMLPEGKGMINADVILQLRRMPEGEWLGLSSQTRLDNSGIGTVVTRLCDTSGDIGQVVQTVLPSS